MREKIDYAALLEQRRAERTAQSYVTHAVQDQEPWMQESRPAPEFSFDQWPPEGTPEPPGVHEYLRTREGRCEHGWHLAAQGCPKCGVAPPEQVVAHFLGAR